MKNATKEMINAIINTATKARNADKSLVELITADIELIGHTISTTSETWEADRKQAFNALVSCTALYGMEKKSLSKDQLSVLNKAQYGFNQAWKLPKPEAGKIDSDMIAFASAVSMAMITFGAEKKRSELIKVCSLITDDMLKEATDYKAKKEREALDKLQAEKLQAEKLQAEKLQAESAQAMKAEKKAEKK